MMANDISPIDLVVVNLYPFAQTIAREDCTLEMAIENIDIGGPTTVRAAARNHRDVGIVVDAGDYEALLEELRGNDCGLSQATRFRLATKAFTHTARYDATISNYLSAIDDDGSHRMFPDNLSLNFTKVQEMRYGENPHQSAAFYREPSGGEASVSTANQIQGKDLSFNNIADTDAALECVKQFGDKPACVIVKHATPSGVAYGTTLLQAYDRAYETDPESAFGGIIAFNQKLDADTAAAIVERQFVEVIIAPSVDPAATEVLGSKQNVRVLECGNWPASPDPRPDYKRVNGGLLVQDSDLAVYDGLKVVSERQPDELQMQDLLFAWQIAKYVKSNAIVYAGDQRSIGIGAGQMSRINSARIAAIKAEHAGLEVKGAVMASDAFFPFRDGIDNAASVGISAVIQPGGSMRDEEVINAANEHGMAMVFTSMRHFRH